MLSLNLNKLLKRRQIYNLRKSDNNSKRFKILNKLIYSQKIYWTTRVKCVIKSKLITVSMWLLKLIGDKAYPLTSLRGIIC